MYHKPVLLKSSVDGLNIHSGGVYVDATHGGGGHSRLILERLSSGRLIAFDQDSDVRRNVIDDKRMVFIGENFRYMKNFLKLYKALPVDGVLADLGVSSWQIDRPERGFSTRHQGPLDMRMDKEGERSAADVINSFDIKKLANVFRLYGEVKGAHKMADEIVFQRKSKRIERTDELLNILQKFAPRGKENKFYAQIFQALRIEVNNEMEVLREFLTQCAEVIKPQGRMVIISYHSLEDRLVKNFIKAGNFHGEQQKDFFGNVLAPFKPVGKLIVPDKEEQEENPRSRSAKLRIAEKTS